MKEEESYFTKCIDGTEVRVGDRLKLPTGEIKKIVNIMVINALVDRFDFEDGEFIFCGDEWEKMREKK